MFSEVSKRRRESVKQSVKQKAIDDKEYIESIVVEKLPTFLQILMIFIKDMIILV